MNLTAETAPRSTAKGPALLGVVGLASLAALIRASTPVLSGPDPFWHWDLGRRIVSSGLPKTDPYSFLTGDESWILNQWGTEAIIGVVDWLAGLWGVAALAALLVGAVYLHVGWRMWRRAASLITLVGLGLAFLAGLSNLTLRGNLFTFLLLPWLLDELDREGGPRPLIVLPMMVVWTNLHAGFVLGLAVLIAHTCGSVLIGTSRYGWSSIRSKLLLILGAASATVVTPYGPGLVAQVIDLSLRGAGSGITEWAPPSLTAPETLPFTLLLTIVLVAVATTSDVERLPCVLVIVVLALLGMSSQRNVAPAALGLALLGAPHVVSLQRRLRGTTRPGVRSLTRTEQVAAIVLSVAGAVATLAILPATNDLQRHTKDTPLAAIGALQERGQEARVFASNLWTPAIAVLTDEDVKTAVDGRLELFSQEEMRRWSVVNAVLPGWDDQLDVWCITDVVVPSDSALHTALTADDRWDLEGAYPVSADEVSVWLRRAQVDC